MAKRKHILIGCGSAALKALEKIREVNSEDQIKLVTMENYPPYSPAALPYLLSGKITESQLWIKGQDFFNKLRITLERSKKVTRVLPDKKRIVYQDGSSETYDTLLIASGSEPVLPPINGLNEVESYCLRTLDDCYRLKQQMGNAKDVAILGAGLIGMKIASVLLEKGVHIKVIERESSILPLYFNEEVEGYLRDIFTENMADFFVGYEVLGVKRKKRKIQVKLSDGYYVDADIIINATGVRSRVSFLEGTSVEINKGILVDERMGTNIDHIYAAGDVAEAMDFFTHKPNMNAIIYNAVSQGNVAGINMAEGNKKYEGGIPMMGYDFLGNQAFSIGMISPPNSSSQVFKQKDDQKKKFRKLIFDNDRLVGGMFLNDEIDPGIILYLIKRRVDMKPYMEALFEGTKPLSNPWLSFLKSYAPIMK